ncbi:clasp N terminal-domain-containing protein [Delphinella strobiligena]|nr:clasp N terminal-domain-containing protein [Delphinella strobiligena]
MDQQAATLLATLRRTSAASEAKLTLLNTLKSDIKHHRVPESAQPMIFDCLKYAISQQSSSTIATAGLTTFSHLIKRLKIQDPEGAAIRTHAPKLLPALQERLGDLRESHRAGASQAFSDLWFFCSAEVEQVIRDEAIASSHVRAKDAGMQWVVKMNREASLPFKSFVPYMVLNLEDADGTVRDTAKSSLIDLFKTAPDRAKADLKKQLNMHNVRAGIAAQVLNQIENTAPPEVDMTASTRFVPTFDPHFTESINSEAARPPPQEEVPMDPIYLHSLREVEDALRDMLPFFEGRETEENWITRDKSVTKLRRILKGNAPSDYYQAFMLGIKQLQEGIMKVANSLRTTMSTNGCLLVQELARTLGPALDPMVEIYMQNFIKMCAGTKNIAAQNGNHTVETLFQYVTINARVMQHLWLAVQDKNVQPRTFAANWLSTVLNRQAGSKSHFEHIGGLDIAEKTIKKGLNDSQPKVKESMRAAYWTLAKSWPEKAETIKNTLDEKAKTALERDSHNPNAPAASAQSGGLRPSTASRAQSRASVRDAILAARKNLKADRPVSAMAAPSLSPAVNRSKSSNNLSVRPPPATSARVPSNPSSTPRPNDTASSSTSTLKPNSLMSGAARRPVRKPEMPRPATADPYAQRRLLRPETPSTRSPANSPRQDTAASLARNAAASATRKKLESESPAASPARQYPSPRTGIPSPKTSAPSPRPAALSPRPSPRRAATSPRPLTNSRPASKDGSSIPEEPSFSKDEEFTLVIPSGSKQAVSPPGVRRRPAIDKTVSVDSGIPAHTSACEDGSLPASALATQDLQQPLSPSAQRTLARSMSEDPSHIVPLAQRLRRPSDRADLSSPKIRAPSVPRQPSPLKTSTAAPPEDFQIHEDSSNGRTGVPEAVSPTPQEPRVLNELPVNESSQPSLGEDDISQHGAVSPLPMTPESKAESIRSRKLLISGIERIRSRTLDAHGFRKVLELVRSSDSGDIFGSVGETKRFDDLFSALLDYIVEAPEPAGATIKHTHELKRQAITVMRTLINKPQTTYKKWMASGRWCQRILVGAFDARKAFEGMGLMVKDLETLVSDVVTKVHPEDGERAVLSWLEQDYHEAENVLEKQQDGVIERSQAKSQARATALALRTLTTLLGNAKGSVVLADIKTRVGSITAACLKSYDAEIRKAAVEVATQLHEVTEVEADYWALLEKSGVQESARNLITYFIARREKGS